MQLNLRKARKLETKIGSKVSHEQLKTSVTVRTKSDASAAVQSYNTAANALADQLTVLNQLNAARFEIRRLIGQANENTGINALMNRREALKARQAILTKVVATDTSSSEELLDTLETRRRQLDKGDGGLYGDRSVTSSVSVITEVGHAAYQEELVEVSRQLEDIEEELTQKNVGSKVTLSDDTVALLKSNNLI